MKTKLFLFCLLSVCICFAQEVEHHPTFKISGLLTDHYKKLRDYQVILSYEGGFTDTISIGKSNRPIFITLKRNEVYTLVFHKAGYHDKMIMINTTLPDSVDTSMPFELSFEIEMHPNKSRLHPDYIDFPVAIYRFERKEEDFDYSKTYHLTTHKN